MSDARSLLRARKADATSRINHPYAAYNASGQLRCTVCVIAIKNATAWAGHLGSKIHRTNVAQLKAKQAESEAKVAGKRKEPEPDSHSVSEEATADGSANKKRRRPTEFPADFFSDPNHPVPDPDDEEIEDANGNPPPPTPPEKAAEKSVIDLEWEEFQRTVINAPAPIVTDPKSLLEETKLEGWNRATVFAEAELAPEVPEGFPERTTDQSGTAPKEEARELTEEEKAQEKAQDERELIMDRLLAEEQAQEDADNRVAVLKARLDGIRKRKEAAKLMKQKQ